jgi:glycosyltransferase involved in cell wall biosynthesis
VKIIAFSNCLLDPVLGSGRTRLAWSAGLRALGHEVRVVDTQELLAGSKENPGDRRWRLGWNGWRWLQTHDLSEVDLIEFYGAEFWPATWRLAAKQGPRPFLSAHTDGLELLAAERLAAAARATPALAPAPGWRAAAKALLRCGEKRAFSRCDGFVTGCELDRRYLLERGIGNPERMEVIPLGLEPDYLDQPAPGLREERVGFLGSWIARKGIAHLIKTMSGLLESRPNLCLDLFGIDEEESRPLEDFPAALRTRITVQPRLPIPALIQRVSQARVFFFPSEYEGFGLGLAEAMACGCAAVTTPTGFGAELVDGREALLCDFGDTAAMRAGIERLLDDAPLCARVAEAGWQRVQGLRWETSVRRLEETYLQWTAERRRLSPDRAKTRPAIFQGGQKTPNRATTAIGHAAVVNVALKRQG